MLKNLRTKEGRLLRTYGAAPGQKAEARLNAYLDDYAYLVHGLLCLHDVTGEKRWLDEAKSLTDVDDQISRATKARRLLLHVERSRKAVRPRQGPVRRRPALGNSMAASQLGASVDQNRGRKYEKGAEKTFKALAAPLKSNPASLASLADALGLYLHEKK